MTAIEAGTFCLFHAETLRDSSVRHVTPVQTGADAVALGGTQKKFGTLSLDAYTPNYGGLRFVGSAPTFDRTDMTTECWAWFKSHRGNNSQRLVSSVSGPSVGFSIKTDSAGKPAVEYQGATRITGPNTLPLSQWVHLAATCDRFGVRRLFVDGVLTAVGYDTPGSFPFFLPPDFARDFIVGGTGDSGGYSPDAFIDEARYTFGVPVYGRFVPPSAAYANGVAGDSLLLHGEGSEGASTITDSSSNALTPTQSGSSGNVVTTTAAARIGTRGLQFSGTSSLTYAASSLFNLAGSANFTVDTWARLNSGTGTDPVLFEFGIDINNRIAVFFNVPALSLRVYMVSGGVGGVVMSVDEDIRGRWAHIALVREGSVWTLNIDGEPRAHAFSPSVPTGNLTLCVGRHFLDASAAVFYFAGAMDEFRVQLGTARFPINFTPQSAAYSDPPSGVSFAIPSAYRRPGAAASAITPQYLNTLVNLRDLFYGGRGKVDGTVKEKASPTNVPLRRRVLLIRERDGLCCRETWSDATTGAYSFTNIDERYTYTVVSYDYLHGYRATIADNLTPTVA